MKISKVRGREILNSRGFPTVECLLMLENGHVFTASVPSGISLGVHEAVYLQDNDVKRVMGMGVLGAVKNIEEEIAPLLIGKEPHLIQMDLLMIEKDGTNNKSRLGANAILAVSLALARAHAKCEELELYAFIAHLLEAETVNLPYPWFNMISGGAHADNGLRIQEFLVMPAAAQSFREATELACIFYYTLRALLEKHGKRPTVGIEGGFTSNFKHDIEALEMLLEVINMLDGHDTYRLGLDVAASQFYNKKDEVYNWNGKFFASDEMIGLYHDILERYPVSSIEDGLSELDVDGWQRMTAYFEEKIQVVGDDIFATNPERIADGIEQYIANAAIIKPNQIGTVTETLQAVRVADENNYGVIISHRSGETNDTFIADLAVGTSAGQIKSGGCSRGERVAKYNRLLRIEDDLVLNILDE